MTRDATPYEQMGRERIANTYTGQAIDKPEPGFFRHRLRSGAVAVGVEIRYGAPLDPITGEELDRGWRFYALVNGKYHEDFDRVWPACVANPITEQEYRRLCATQEWANENAPNSPQAKVGKKVDWLDDNVLLPF